MNIEPIADNAAKPRRRGIAPTTRTFGLAVVLLSAAVAMGCGESSNPTFTNPDELPPLTAGDADGIKAWDQEVADAERAAGAITIPASSRSKKR